MAGVALIGNNIIAGQTFFIETSGLPGGSLSVTGSAESASNVNFLALTAAKSDVGVGLTATATGGAMGVSRTAGTSLFLAGETTSTSAVTDKAMWEFSLPASYTAGNTVGVTVNVSVSGAGTLTAASTTMALAAYSEVNGVETALTVTGGTQQLVAAGSNLAWTIAATGLAAGSHLSIELTMVVTSSSGSNTGHVNSISFVA